MNKQKLSQIIGQKYRAIIPLYFQDEYIGDITIENPTQEYANFIKECLKEKLLVDDELHLDMLKKLTNIDIDVEINPDTMKYYSEVFESVMIEISSIIFEIASNQALEAYSMNKMPENKKQMLMEILDEKTGLVDEIKKAVEDKNKSKEIKQAEQELLTIQNKIASLRGE